MDNILRQQQADGGRLKVNAPSTRAGKRRKGRPTLSLIDEKHRFIRAGRASWDVRYYLANGEGVVVGPANAELQSLVRHTAAMGYTGYIGLSARGKAALRALLKQFLVRLIQQAAVKRR